MRACLRGHCHTTITAASPIVAAMIESMLRFGNVASQDTPSLIAGINSDLDRSHSGG
jgi:hypothetical protein